jgi:branched-chain amino acid transport system substrate-binding protein
MVVAAVMVAACGGSGDTGSGQTPTTTPSSGPATPAPTPSTTSPGSDASTDGQVPVEVGADPFTAVVADLPAPTGAPFRLGLVNTEGVPGLDFPEIRTVIEAAAAYLNGHGGFGGRPVELLTCIAAGSPESSQACAQELVAKRVDVVLLGFDLFAHYPTYGAAGVPVIGALPILPPDYQADALFVTGGNLTVTAAMAGVASRHFAASKVAIISADDLGSNSTEASLIAALNVAGIGHVSLKGAASETDAGFQGLLRQASRQGVDLVVSLYGGDGCLGIMLGRVALGIATPVLSTTACAGDQVLSQAGEAAAGWTFAGVGDDADTPDDRLIRTMVAAFRNVDPGTVDTGGLGLGILGLIGIMSLAKFAHLIAEAGSEVTGAALYEFMGADQGVDFWPSGPTKMCGRSATYPSVCSFDFPVAEYVVGEGLRQLPGLASVSALDFLP